MNETQWVEGTSGKIIGERDRGKTSGAGGSPIAYQENGTSRGKHHKQSGAMPNRTTNDEKALPVKRRER